MARRYYSSSAARTTLTADINSSAVSISIAAATNLPASYPFTMVIDQDTTSEEVVEVTSAVGTTLTVIRGVDGTTAVAHYTGASINHGVSARDFDEPNAHIQDTGLHAPIGAVVPFAGLTVPTNWLACDGSTVNKSSYPALFSAVTVAFTGATTTLSTTVSGLSGMSATTHVGWGIAGNGIPTGATIVSVTNATTVVISAAATVAQSGTASLWIGPYGFTGANNTTTFNLPNIKGKVIAGVDTADTDFDTQGQTGGSKTSTAPHTHAVDHNHASENFTSGGHSADHTHAGNTGNVSADHSHSGNTGYVSSDHAHWKYIQDRADLANTAGGKYAKQYGNPGEATSGFHANHYHGFSTGGISANHTHSYTSGGTSVGHTHTTAVDLAAFTGTSGASSVGATSGNMPPYITMNYIIRAA